MQIGYLNVVPKVEDHGAPTRDANFDDVNETVYKFNQWCKDYPIPGQREGYMGTERTGTWKET